MSYKTIPHPIVTVITSPEIDSTKDSILGIVTFLIHRYPRQRKAICNIKSTRLKSQVEIDYHCFVISRSQALVVLPKVFVFITFKVDLPVP